MSNDLDARIKVGADTREAEVGIDRVNAKVTTMGESASKAGGKASAALDGMGRSSEAAATKFTRSESALGVALRRTVEQMEIAVHQAKSVADAFQIKADIRGFDASKFDPMLDRLRQLEGQLSVAKAAEEDFAAQNAFAKKHQQATELNQAGQYTSWWAAELKKAEEAERELAAQNAFAKKHQQAADLTKASQYTDWWAAELQKADAAEAELGAQNAFAKKHQQATELAKASQYASWWAAELEKVDAAERKLAAENAFVSSLKSQSDAIGKTRADLLELQAAQMGVTSQAAPFIAKLREAESGVGRMGVSAGQTRAALAQLPMQFSDIVVSLQGGQAPLTVFLQQGAQIKDSFGGAGAALKAMAGYVLGLVNPYTVAAAAVVALGVAMAHAESKLRANMALMAQLEATGRAGYLNSDAIKQLKKDMVDLPGISKSMASAIISDLVQVRTLGGEALQKIALLSADFAVATGQTAADAAKELAKAMEDPAKAAKALDEAFNFLTVEQLIAIDAMVEAGDKAGAQKMLLDALGQSIEGTSSKQTDLQKATKELSNAWDDLMGNMSPSAETMRTISAGLGGMVRGINDLTEAIPRLNAEITQWFPGLQALMGPLGMLMRVQGLQTLGAEANGGTLKPPAGGGAGRGSTNPPLVDAGGSKSAADQTLAELLESTKGFKAKKDAADELGKTLSRLQAQQKRLRDEGRGDSKAAEEVQARINGVTEKIKTLSKTRDDGSKKERSTYAELAASIQAKIDVNKQEFEFSGKLNEAQKAEIKLNSDLKEGKIKLSEAHEKDLRKRIDEWKQQEKAQEKAKQNVAMYEQQLDIEKQLTEDYLKRSNALTAARLAMDAYEKTAQEDHERLQLEAGLIGMSNQARAVALAQYDAELELKRRIAEINKLDAKEPQKAELRERERVAAAKKIANAQTAAFVSEWGKGFDQTSQALTDALMRGGKNGGELLRDYFRTLTLNPIIKAIADPIAAPITSGIQSMLGQGPGSNALGTANSVQSLWSSFSGGLTGSLGGAIAGLGAQLGSTAATAFGSGVAAGGQLGLFGGGIGQGMSLIGSGAAGSTAAGLGTIAGAVAPWLAGASALYSIIKGFDDSGTPHSGAGAVYSKATGVQSGAGIYNQATFGMGHRDEYSDAMQAGISGIAQGLGQTLDAFAVSFGKTAGYSVATAFADDSSKDGSWGSLKIADELGKVLINWEDSRASKWAPREFADGEEGYKQYLNAVAADVKNAFVAMDLPTWADQLLNAATDIDTLNTALQQIATVKSAFESVGKTMEMFADISGDVQTRLLAASGGVEAFASNAEALYQGFYTEQERGQRQRELQMAALAGAGLYIDPYQGGEAKAMFKRTVEEAMASGQVELAAKLMAMSGAFAEAADYGQKLLEDTAEKAREVAEERSGLEQQLMQVQGDTVALRALERDALDETNRALYDQVMALTDAKEAAEAAAEAVQQLAEGYAGHMTAARSAMDAAGALWDRIDAAQGGSGTGYARIREQRLWDAMVQADYKQQIELAGELTDMVLNRHQLEQANATKLLDFGKSLRSYVDGLKIGSLSPLTMGEKLAEAAKQWGDTLAKANGGDETARGALQGISSSYLDLARQYYASGDDYTKIFNSVTGSLDALGVSSQSDAQLQLGVASQSLAQLQQLQGILWDAYGQAESDFSVEKDLLQRQVNEMLRTADGIEAVRDLLGGMPAELATLLNGGAAEGTGSFATLAQNYVSLLGGAGGSSTDPRYVAQAMGHINSANWQSELSNAMGLLTDPGARTQMQAIFDAVAKMKGIDGSHADGLGYVPFDNYIAQLHKGERVLTAEENRAYTPTWSSYGRGGGLEALVSEIKALRTEVSQLRTENRQDSQMLTRATVESNGANAERVVDGLGRATERAAYAQTVQGGYK